MKETKDTVNYRFPKEEKLRSKKKIDALFRRGASFYFYPFTIKFLEQENDASCHQVLISVSKRNFKKAVDRNRIKRLIREAYRLNKHPLLDLDGFYSIAYIYTGKEIHDFKFVNKKLKASIDRILAKVEKHNS